MNAIFTITTKNYLAYTRTLVQSCIEHNPGITVFVLLADKVDEYFDKDKEPFILIEAEELEIPGFKQFTFKYTAFEFCNSLKPFFAEHLFAKYNIKKLIYFDSDILVMNNLTDIFDMLDNHNIIITPHITKPLPDDGKIVNDVGILKAGVYNMGFFALTNYEKIKNFLSSWKHRLYKYCISDTENGLFVDQKWIDLLIGYRDDILILRGHQYNVAYWNLHYRNITKQHNFLSNGIPISFFHFSGADIDTNNLSIHQNRFNLRSNAYVHELFNLYKNKVKKNEYDITRKWDYHYGKFNNGMYISDKIRHDYYSTGNSISMNPYDGQNLKNIKNFGVNIYGDLGGIKGTSEAPRQILAALKNAKFNTALNGGEFFVNLFFINADGTPVIKETLGNNLSNRYNIGFWFWELQDFPEKWNSCFDIYDEIWVASDFCLDSIKKNTNKPVTKIPLPISVEEIAADKKYFGINEDTFVFLFAFDFHSKFERKNPLAIIEAFKKAFSASDKVLLIIKTINASDEKNKLYGAAEGFNIRIVEDMLPKQDMRKLMATADCYVSLHRSEGYGLTMAESMAQGKPVIATGYSGNMEFTNKYNSYLVDYKMKELDVDIDPYEKGNVWAEPNITTAADYMYQIYSNRHDAYNIGQIAKIHIRNKFNVGVIGNIIAARLNNIYNGEHTKNI